MLRAEDRIRRKKQNSGSISGRWDMFLFYYLTSDSMVFRGLC